MQIQSEIFQCLTECVIEVMLAQRKPHLNSEKKKGLLETMTLFLTFTTDFSEF